MPHNGQMKLFTGTANPALGQEVADFLGIALGGVHISRFASGEIYVRYEESVRGVDVFVVQPLVSPVNENLVELLIMIDALKRASAGRASRRSSRIMVMRGRKKSPRRASRSPPGWSRILSPPSARIGSSPWICTPRPSRAFLISRWTT